MTKKNYIAIAEPLAGRFKVASEAQKQVIIAIAHDLCKVFENDNPLFQRSKFLEAIGII